MCWLKLAKWKSRVWIKGFHMWKTRMVFWGLDSQVEMLASSQLGFRSNRKAVQIVYAQGCKGVWARDSGEGVPRDAAECVPRDAKECVPRHVREYVPKNAGEFVQAYRWVYVPRDAGSMNTGMQINFVFTDSGQCAKRCRREPGWWETLMLKVKQGQPCNMPQSRLSILS